VTTVNETMHTPGPWTVEQDDQIWVRPASIDDPVICDLAPRDADVFTEEDEANGRLIAAAPDLLAQLKRAVQLMEDADLDDEPHDDEGHLLLQACRAAIAKAEGQP
jgi:hypothetical protein